MQQRNKIFGMALLVFLSTIFAAGSAVAGQGKVEFTASITTTEFLLPAEQCAPGAGGIGAGVGTTNLFTNKPATETTKVVLTSFDCVYPPADGSIGPITFSQGKFTLTGAGEDTIFATYSGTLNPTGYDPVTGIVAYEFAATTFNIQGGTGRYTKAVGAGTIGGTEAINPATSTAQGKLVATGSIVY